MIETCVRATGSTDAYGHVDRFSLVPYYPSRRVSVSFPSSRDGGTGYKRSEPVAPRWVRCKEIGLGEMEVML